MLSASFQQSFWQLQGLEHCQRSVRAGRDGLWDKTRQRYSLQTWDTCKGMRLHSWLASHLLEMIDESYLLPLEKRWILQRLNVWKTGSMETQRHNSLQIDNHIMSKKLNCSCQIPLRTTKMGLLVRSQTMFWFYMMMNYIPSMNKNLEILGN